jgi:hypothetical protein
MNNIKDAVPAWYESAMLHRNRSASWSSQTFENRRTPFRRNDPSHQNMPRLPFLLLLVLATIGRAGEATKEEPVQMAPVTVTENPLGWIGVMKFHGKTSPLALLTKSARMRNLFFDEIAPGSSGERAGLVARDEVLEIDGTPIREISIKELIRILSEKEVGDSVRLLVRHAGASEPSLLTVKIERPPRKPKPVPAPAASAPAPTKLRQP